MTLLAITLAEAEKHYPTILPVFVFPLIAFAFFLVLGVTAWSYRNVAYRHSEKFTTGGHGHDDSHGAGH